MPLRCGRIAYTNDLAIYAAFDEGVLAYPGTLHSDVPSKLNAMLLEGKLDFSPISAFALAKHADELVMLPELCIGARDDVISVVLVSPTPPSGLDGATIALTDESASAVGLLRILLLRHYGVRATYRRTHGPLNAARAGKPALLIGDSAIDARFIFEAENVYDLGRLWRDWTGEESVFAVWAARRDVCETRSHEVNDCLNALLRARDWGLANLERVAAAAQRIRPRPDGFYDFYYDALKFKLDRSARARPDAVLDRAPGDGRDRTGAGHWRRGSQCRSLISWMRPPPVTVFRSSRECVYIRKHRSTSSVLRRTRAACKCTPPTASPM